MPSARAVRIREPGDVDVLEIGEIAVREPGPGEILVEVAAAGLNRADLLQRRGLYPAPPGVPPDVPGLEYAGVAAAVGEGVTAFAPGDRLMGIVGGGAMATWTVVHEREVLRIPDNLSFAEAAAIPEVFLTAYDALFCQAGLRMGEVVLLHAVASGVGTAALQLARIAGARAIGTSRTQEKLERCAELGLSASIRAEGGRFADRVAEITGGRLADVILDCVGAAYLAENLRALAPLGRLVVLGLLGGATGEMPLGLLVSRRVRVMGSVLRSRPLEEKAALAQRFSREVLPLFADGQLKPVIDAVLRMEEIRDAHRRMERNENIGKIVLSWQR
jgi:putative PIG3 family NAD(P)H quinone oxidoreductase